MNRNVRNQPASTAQATIQQQPSPIPPGSDPMITSGSVVSPHSHPGMMQQQQQQQQPTSIGPPGQSPLARYMMAQSPQNSLYRPQASPMNMINYTGSPTAMIDDEMHFLFKFFNERILHLTRVIARYQQDGQHDKVAKYRQLQDQMSNFVRNPIPEHLMSARRLKEHVDRMLGPIMMPPINDTSTAVPSSTNNSRLISNGIFEQCQRTIVDYLNKDPTLKFNISKRFLEPLSEVLNGVPHKTIRLDSESKQIIDQNPPLANTHSDTSLINIIESEFAHLSTNTYSYELKPMYDKISSSPSILKNKDLLIHDYELTCRFVENNMPIVPPLKMKLTIQYPNVSPEILSLVSTTMNTTPNRLENSGKISVADLGFWNGRYLGGGGDFG
ncbi:unnamed protein product [Adineta steineri]|nr:unnamed protein product [Adineta steineri]